jgi:hypothetical protein
MGLRSEQMRAVLAEHLRAWDGSPITVTLAQHVEVLDARWLAWPLAADDVPAEPFLRLEIALFWWTEQIKAKRLASMDSGYVPVGRGDSPDAALADLFDVMAERNGRPAQRP